MYSLTLLAKNNWLVHQYLALQYPESCKTVGCVHSDILEVGIKIQIRNKGLLGEGKIVHFYLYLGRIIGNFHSSIVLMGILGINISSYRRENLFFQGGGESKTAHCNL